MAKRKPGLSLEQHKELGLELAAMRDRLVEIQTLLGNLYPIRGAASQAKRRIRRATNELDEARGELDSLVFREHPREAEPAIYYPARRRRQQEQRHD
jgi:hypothetical protein